MLPSEGWNLNLFPSLLAFPSLALWFLVQKLHHERQCDLMLERRPWIRALGFAARLIVHSCQLKQLFSNDSFFPLVNKEIKSRNKFQIVCKTLLALSLVITFSLNFHNQTAASLPLLCELLCDLTQ